ncbi:MAG: TonB-dependent receptor [Bacteroidetes bacterium]|nr:TonB-dependent receptor [Bacteroidota bacterium]
MAFLLSGLITMGQQAVICVVDAKTKEAIPFANVCFDGIGAKSQKHLLSDMKGNVPNDLVKAARVVISCMGYETLTDTLLPGESKSIGLTPTIFNMNEVVVTAQYSPEKADKSIYNISVINSRQIEQKAATNLTDLLSGENSMRIVQGGVLGSSISMLGLSGENVKILVDGIPVIGRMNGNIDLNQLNLYNVDHVEVIEGPMSVIYGSNAIAGVINIITKENKSAAFASFLNSYYESIGMYNFDGGISKRLKKNLFSIDASRNFFGGSEGGDSLRKMRWKPRRQYNADASYLYSDKKIRIKLTGQYFNEMLLDKGQLLQPYYETAFDNYFTTVRSTAKVESSYSLNEGELISLVAAYSTYNRIKNQYFKDLTTLNEILTPNPDDQDTTTFKDYLLRAWYNKNSPNNILNYQMGIDLIDEAGTGKRILNQKQEIGDYAAFISFKYDPFRKLSVQPGLRAIYNTKYKAPIVYSVNLKWVPQTKWAVRASFAKGFKAPDLKQLYLYFIDISHNVRGNQDLKAEYSYNYSLSCSYNSEAQNTFFKAEASLFYNDITNNITLSPSKSNLYTYVNIGKHLSRGIQANASWSLYPLLNVSLGFSRIAEAYAFDATSIGKAKNYWSNDIMGTLNYKMFNQKLTFCVFYKYTGQTPEAAIQDDNSLAVRWVDRFSLVDLTLMHTLLHKHLTLSAGIKNLTNVTTVAAVGGAGGAHSGNSNSSDIAWGRTCFVKLAFNFNKY